MFPGIKRYHINVFHFYQNKPIRCKICCKTSATALKNSFPSHLERFDAGSGAALPFFPRHSCHATSIGAATAIEEYVPIRIPTTSAKLNPFSTGPPKI